MGKRLFTGALCCLCAAVIYTTSATGQSFTRVTDSDNPIVTDSGPGGYAGASWIDYNGDGHLDLFVGLNRLYRNNGDRTFTKLTTNIGANQSGGTGVGNSWADVDNDGDLDVYVSGGTSFLYINNGDGTFSKVESGDIGDGSASRGWACAWADYNNDGAVDLAITHPAGFVQPTNSPTNNHLFLNSGAPNFTLDRITNEPIVSGPRTAYTVGTWSDYDQDGDMDYFIGAGPANGGTQVDYLFQNRLSETDSVHFTRITEAPIGSDRQDGQVWNWIDYDNDGDLDAYLTNWGGASGATGIRNRLYRNDDGTFVGVTGQPIADDRNISLSSVWGDFDNDGDLDCYVATDRNQANKYYQNDGDGTFASVTTAGITEPITHRGATAGDYDNDGDLDLLGVGPNTAMRLYRNDTQNGNASINILCVGTQSNAAAIGTTVRAKATIGGTAVWQTREVLAQNNFNGQNSLRVHFGLGDATVIDSLVIEWPLGLTEVHENVSPNNFYRAVEGQSFGVDPTTDIDTGELSPPAGFELEQNYPNPFNPETIIRYSLAQPSDVIVRIYNPVGELVKTLVRDMRPAGQHAIAWNGTDRTGREVASGVYFYEVAAEGDVRSRKMALVR